MSAVSPHKVSDFDAHWASNLPCIARKLLQAWARAHKAAISNFGVIGHWQLMPHLVDALAFQHQPSNISFQHLLPATILA